MTLQPKIMLTSTDQNAVRLKRYEELAARFDSLSKDELEEFGFLKSLVKEVGRRMLGREKKDEEDEGGSSDFDEAEHPRDADDGKFVKANGGGSKSTSKAPEAPKEDLEGDIKRAKAAVEVAKGAKSAAEKKAQKVADNAFKESLAQWEEDKKTHEKAAKKAHEAKMQPIKEAKSQTLSALRKAESQDVDENDYKGKINRKRQIKGLKTKLHRYEKQLKEQPEPFPDPKPEKIDVTPGKKGIKYVPFI